MAIQTGENVSIESEFMKILVVGDYGTGKSVFASTFPGKLFIFDFDKGIKTYRGKDFDYAQYEINAKGYMEFDKEFKDVEKSVREGKYKTVIVDSTSLLSDLAMERALMLDPKRSPTNGPLWNVHYGIVKNLVEGKLRQIMQWPCHVVILAHLQVVTDQESGAVVKIQPLLPGALSDKLPGWFDEVYVAQNQMKNNVVEFTLQTLPRGHYKARSRISGQEQLLPMYIPNTYQDLMKAVDEGRKKQKK